MAWTRWLSPWWLLASALVVCWWAVALRSRRRSLTAAALLLLAGTLAGFVGHVQLLTVSREGGGLSQAREERVSATLSSSFEALLAAGDDALQATLEAAQERPDSLLQADVERIHGTSSITGLAVYDRNGQLEAWAGTHRGPVPLSVRRADAPYSFAGGPLFRYLYFTARVPDTGETVVVAVLLQASLPAGPGVDDFVSRFRRQLGLEIEVLPPHRVSPPAVWDLRWGGEPLLSVSLRSPGQAVLSDTMGQFWARLVAGLGFLAWVAAVLGGRGLPGVRLVAAATLLLGALVIPVHQLWSTSPLNSTDLFSLPGPLAWSMARILSVLVGLCLLAGFLGLPNRPRVKPLVVCFAVGLGFPLAKLFFDGGPSQSLLLEGEAGWLAYQVSFALLLSLVSGLFIGLSRRLPDAVGVSWSLMGSVVGAVFLALVGGFLARSGPGFSPWFLSLWAIPGFLAARGIRDETWKTSLVTWGTALVLGSTAALPAAWERQIKAEMTAAAENLAEVGAAADPELEARLRRMGQVADSLDPIIASPVDLLFETWAQSRGTGNAIPMWLTVWSPGDIPGEELALGVWGDRPSLVDVFQLETARESGAPTVRHLGLQEVHYVVLIPLSGGRVMSGVVPPQPSLSGTVPVEPLSAALAPPAEEPLTLVPILPGDVPSVGPVLRWTRSEEGWEGERSIEYPDGLYQARYSLVLPSSPHMVARGTLVLLLDLALFALIWGVGRVLSRGTQLPYERALQMLGGFRSRLTLALFGFFLLSLAIFGTLAFQTLTGAAQRTASALAGRIVGDGASFYSEFQGSMELLARRAGADLLEYREGQLREGSSDELVELGLYDGWIPEPVFRDLTEGQAVRASVQSSLGSLEYVMAYHRLPDGDILGAPVPLEVGATALQRREVTDLLGFAVVLGAALTMGLALLVGRTLSRPIEILQVASERVGKGNLRVQLPDDRTDEFGEVFSAFNRMVLGIRRARKALERTTRRTQAIVEEAAMGVVGLDPSGRVTLVNPKAEALLGQDIPTGESLPRQEGGAGELVRWVDLYFRDGLLEANSEFQLGDRRIRVRARRVSREGPAGGAVLSLEDVTDELRTERVLAWGEMAQQVAHEVKNPLTPIKLSVQHLRRAWEDKRPDYSEILDRNVESILREIDHLATIARSFSRFGAPKAAGELPLEPVNVDAVAREVLDLYQGGKGALTFTSLVPEGLPPVQAREAELREVLINLLENSRAAIPEKGAVTIEAEAGQNDVEVRVRDDGTGIPRALLSRVFEPHFSSRSTGTGLGLAIVRRIVESWGGVASADSRQGEGTVIRLRIPAWTEAGEADLADLEEKDAW